jgi:hypothetical protein
MKKKLARAKTNARRRLLVERLDTIVLAQGEKSGATKGDIIGATAAVLIGALAPEGSTPIVVEPGAAPVRYSRDEIRRASFNVLDRCVARLTLRALDSVADGLKRKRKKDELREA